MIQRASMRAALRWVVTAAALVATVTAFEGVAAPRASTAHAAAEPAPAAARSVIRWRSWSPAAFEDARRSRRLVLLHLTTSWSRSAHEMDRDAWSDSSVAAIVQAGFVPVRVDADRRPDIADRYLSTGYPTTAILDADGQVLVSGAVVAAAPLRRMLEEIRTTVRDNRAEIVRRSAESALAIARTWEGDDKPPSTTPFEKWLDLNLDAVRQAEDKKFGGFGAAPKLPQFESIGLLHAAAVYRDDPALRAMALHATDAAMRLQDSTWGGFFRFARDEDWKRPRTEKLIGVNAAAISTLARAYAVSAEPRYRAAARQAESYAARWLWDDRRGGFYASQDADAGGSSGSGKPGAADQSLTGDVFYGLSDRARRRRQAPAVDSIFTADGNARFASAILAGARARMWEGASVHRAIRALDRLWAEQRAPDGSIFHVWERGAASVPGILADQAAAGTAYLDAYEATGDARHMERARALARYIRQRLEDRSGGGFRYAPRDSSAVGRLRAGEKPEVGNIEAATFFLKLWEKEHRAEDLESATRAFDWLRSGEVVVLDPARAELGIRMAAVPRHQERAR